MALLLGAGRFAVRGSVDILLFLLLLTLAVVAGWPASQYRREARARRESDG